MNVRRWILAAACLLLLLSGSGCATKALWETSNFDASNEPAGQDNFRLFYSNREKDLLVVYNEYSERGDSVQTRAYFVYKNQERVEQRRRPAFVNPRRALDLEPVALFSLTNAPLGAPPEMLYAVVYPSGHSFTLFSGERIVGSHMLPVYDDGKGKMGRVALTPLAATADLAIAAGYLSVLFLHSLGESHYSFTP